METDLKANGMMTEPQDSEFFHMQMETAMKETGSTINDTVEDSSFVQKMEEFMTGSLLTDARTAEGC